MKKILALLFLVVLFILGCKFFDQNRINLIVQAKPVLVASLTPAKDELTLLFIPDGTNIEVIHGYGLYRVESIFNLDELEHRKGELLLGSFQEFLGLPLDGYLVIGDLNLKADDKKETIKKLILGEFLRLLKEKNKTNLNRWDLLRTWWQIKKIRPNKMTIVSLDLAKVDQIVNQFFQDERIKNEDLAISVLNTTAHVGLANRGARLISNLGGRVMEIGDWEKKNDYCELRCSQLKLKTDTIQTIKKFFNCQWGGEDLAGHRADLMVILGEDYWRKLNEKF